MKPPAKTGFSRAQQGKFRPLLDRAWLAHCGRTGLFANKKADKEKWYRAELFRVVGVESTRFCDKVHDFDDTMLAFAIIANDSYWIDRIARADERRMIWRINERLRMLSQIRGEQLTWSYARAIYDHMHLPEDVQDCPAELLQKVFQALDTHLRRFEHSVSPEPAAAEETTPEVIEPICGSEEPSPEDWEHLYPQTVAADLPF